MTKDLESGRLLKRGLARVFAADAAVFRMLEAAVWPVADLVIRIWLAQSFFVSGVLSWMSPVTAAHAGASIELAAPVLLTLGLLTRYAAVPLMVLSLVVQLYYRPFDSQLFCAALCGWYAVHGAGPLSIDRILRRGLRESALPVAPKLLRLSEWVRCNVTPWYLLLLRVWLFVALTGVATPNLRGWVPFSSSSSVGPHLAWLIGVALLGGLATRYAALVLAVAAFVGAMMGERPGDEMYLLMILALFVAHGAGWISCDRLLSRWLRRKYPKWGGHAAFALGEVPRVVIVGAGFGGVSCAAALRDARVSITLVDRANYHLFQPLLYQVATAAINPSDIAVPVRSLFRDFFNTTVLRGTVTAIDAQSRVVMIGDKKLPYDYLVIATGAAHSYFGKDQWAPFAPGLKRIEDATAIRSRLLRAFEMAEAAEDPQERAALLTFLVVGAGPTGVELAGAIAELARLGMAKEFRHFDPTLARVILVQSGPRILPTFDERLARIAHTSLEKLGVDISLGSRVEGIDSEGVTVSGKRIVARTVLWAAGVRASAAATWLGCAADSAGRIKVESDLSVSGFHGVYAVGDTALCNAWRGQPVPGLAPAAKQGGRYVARVIRAQLDAKTPPPPFKYRHFGSLATIGRQAAVADFGALRLWGAPAWWLWGCIHVGFLVGVRNRVSTMINWFWAYLVVGNGIKLITEPEEAPAETYRK
jgi:putative oxidoreductase